MLGREHRQHLTQAAAPGPDFEMFIDVADAKLKNESWSCKIVYIVEDYEQTMLTVAEIVSEKAILDHLCGYCFAFSVVFRLGCLKGLNVVEPPFHMFGLIVREGCASVVCSVSSSFDKIVMSSSTSRSFWIA